ncbi:restriction endonuclease subunit S [Chryseobacterium sp. NRRL B-14798]|uniref:restriction endonuclease subunit S n=1 Tax=Chryseobacterium sp. NRRL B-14798 TaxID=3162880 RepID=UPI003D246D5E
MREDWIECTLEDISYKITDGSHNPPKKESNGYLMLSAKNIANNKIDFSEGRFISKENFEIENKRTQIEPNDILLTIVATIGRSAVVKEYKNQFVLQRSVAVIGTFLNSFYLNFQLQNPFVQSFFMNNAKGTAQKGIYLKTLSTTPLQICSIPEQRAIVKKIETLFSSLDASIADLKKSQEQLKIYRQAVLKKAFEGELTNEWRKQQTNLPTVEELLFQIEQERKEYYHIQIEEWKLALQYWEENKSTGKKPEKPSINKIKIDTSTKLESGFYAKLGSISDVVRGGSPRPAGDERFYNGNIPFLKVADITRINNKYLTEFTYTIKPAGLQKTRFLKKGTLVISNSGATLGVARILGIDATANDGIAAFLNLLPRLTDFFYYYLNSKTLEFRAIDQGAGQPNLNTDLLKEFIVPIFSVNEQQQIVQEIESRLSVCDDVEKQIKNSLDQAEALRQSILKKAFEGNLLTEEELKACKAEPDYEPASVLLERMKAEKEAHKPLKKISKKKVSKIRG